MESNGIKSWSPSDQPREKFIQFGRHSLSDAELIAILFRTGNNSQSALDLARLVLVRSGNSLAQLAKMDVQEITGIKGVGLVKAVTLLTALELGKRKIVETEAPKDKIQSSADAAAVFLRNLSELQHEEFWLLLMNRANHVIGKIQLSKGGITGTVADPKLIFNHAIEKLATGIILIHNHPSGNIQPSEADKQLTRKVKEGGALLDITVFDHIIIANNAYFSFADEGLM